MKIEDRVLIAGAGPVGLVAAVSLVENGIPVTVLEASADLAVDLRASTFHPPTIDFLDRLGLADGLIARGIKCPLWQFRDRKEGEVATFDLGILKDETNHPYRLQAEQWKLTEAARARLEGDPNADLITDIVVEEVAQDADSVTVTARRKTGEVEKFRAAYLIGADGARSTVRKSTGVEFPGLTIPEIFLSLSTPFRYDEAIEGLADICYISDPEEWLVLLRTPTLWRVLFPTDPNLSDEEILDPARIEQRMQDLLPGEPYEIAHKTAYRVHERVAEQYVHGRIFLAGDAAHLNNPLGGMGMNGGIHDAVNLADKLTQVWQGASIDLMGRYNRQRRKVAIETVQAQALRNRAVLNETDPAKRQAYHDELRATVDDPQKHMAYVMRSSMIQSLRDLEDVS
ncbi:FAD binding domain protein [Sulfitobacter noctilucicola]|uniref:3-(3-hydroxy-phenyl)propionate hydroxylase n=1 Tax=Sulfitobacter noctilucicola TaxID=1342301 RepID=A0A7W6Q573_9RHOB|nr:NAD(P)/FAD-dependent oxidoreductase [Sulfitobacter noctilucicola]KIN64094.1 FAD binding domain protein [Sulfitobacter noctilucicola]MBB4175448.1 3-(3-hydroxy-phenyl)propionate hydroxylase [Sulfitobacter noctilucicola]